MFGKVDRVIARLRIRAAAGGIPGVVDNGKNGILVPFGDIPSLANAIKLLIEDQELNSILGENGRQKLALNFTWEAVTEKVLSGYYDVTRIPTST